MYGGWYQGQRRQYMSQLPKKCLQIIHKKINIHFLLSATSLRPQELKRRKTNQRSALGMESVQSKETSVILEAILPRSFSMSDFTSTNALPHTRLKRT